MLAPTGASNRKPLPLGMGCITKEIFDSNSRLHSKDEDGGSPAVIFLGVKGTWRDVADSAMTTVNMGRGSGDPIDKWKKRMLLAEHSPVRQLIFKWKWLNLKYWVSVHFVRHWLGIIHWVRSQRSDRTGDERDGLPQCAPVEHECEANAQEIIFISRKRLCRQSSPETRLAWEMVVDEIRKIDPVVAGCCVPECIYRGWCPELNPCGWFGTKEAAGRLAEYRNVDI